MGAPSESGQVVCEYQKEAKKAIVGKGLWQPDRDAERDVISDSDDTYQEHGMDNTRFKWRAGANQSQHGMFKVLKKAFLFIVAVRKKLLGISL